MIILFASLFLAGLLLGLYRSGYRQRREVRRAQQQADAFEKLADKWCGIAEHYEKHPQYIETVCPECGAVPEEKTQELKSDYAN